LSAPYGALADKDRPGVGRVGVGDDRLVKQRRVLEERPRYDHPLRGIAVLEVGIGVPIEECIKPYGAIADVEARLATVAVYDLWPHHCRAVGFKRAVVLCAALKMLGIISCHRQALELQSGKSLVEVIEERRNCGEQLLAERQIRAAEPAVRGALR